MEHVKKGRRGLRLKPLPPGDVPRWLKERLSNIARPLDGGLPDLNVVASSLLHDRQALRWGLSRFKTADRIYLAMTSRFVYSWQLFAATYYARRLAGVPPADSRAARGLSLAKRLKLDPLPVGRRKRCSVRTIMKLLSGLYFNGKPSPGWCFTLIEKDMRCIRNWKHRNPVMFDMLVKGKPPKGLLAE